MSFQLKNRAKNKETSFNLKQISQTFITALLINVTNTHIYYEYIDIKMHPGVLKN